MEKLLVPTTGHRLTGEALRAALAADGDPGSVIGVVGTAGTTNAGIIDDLAGIAEVARESGLWFHVDGAYGGAGLFAPSVRARYDGIELADSFVVDPHKWLFAPFDCAALIYRKPWLAKARAHPGRLLPGRPAHRRRQRVEPHRLRLPPHPPGPRPAAVVLAGGARHRRLQRGGRGRRSAWPRDTAELIRAEYPDLELVHEPELSNLVFRRKGWQSKDYYAWSQRLLADQIGFVTPTGWEGEVVSRFAFLHPGTTMAMVREILDTMS